MATVERLCAQARTGTAIDELSTRLKNSAELALTGDIPLWVLTRVAETNPVQWMATRLGTAVGDYGDAGVSDDVIYTDTDRKSGTYGEYTGDAVRLYFQPGHERDDEGIRGSIRHEYQHATDFHDALDRPMNKVQWSVYVTELRAHWVQDATSFPGSEDHVVTGTIHGHRYRLFERHAQIAEWLFTSGNYPALETAWRTDEEFRKKVIERGKPTFVNKHNDPDSFRRYAPFLFARLNNLDDMAPLADEPDDRLWPLWLKFGTALEQAKGAFDGDQQKEFMQRMSKRRFRTAVIASTSFLNRGWEIVTNSAPGPLPELSYEFGGGRAFAALDPANYDYADAYRAWRAGQSI